ncbi:MAG: hypothetical protein GXY36_12330 [Chloroflexi bacterium]|nr:hypothetical protein [Chloroflexota bacterium]
MDKIVDLEFERGAVNVERLHHDLRGVVGEALAGVSVDGETGRVRVHLRGELTTGMKDQIAAAVAAHDAKRLAPGQQARQDRAALIAALSKPWTDWSDRDRDDLLRLLAESVGIVLPEAGG